MNKKNDGFTMIEILIVVVIIGLLSNMAIVNYGQKTKDAEEVVEQGNMVNVMTAIELYYLDNGFYPDDSLEGSLNVLLGEGGNTSYLKMKEEDLNNYDYVLSEDKISYTVSIKES